MKIRPHLEYIAFCTVLRLQTGIMNKLMNICLDSYSVTLRKISCAIISQPRKLI